MKHNKIIAVILVVMLMFSTVISVAASDPNVTIVSPSVESVVNSDSLLISIKITKPETIRVSVYEEKQLVGDQVVSVDVNNIEELQVAAGATTSGVTVAGVKAETVSPAAATYGVTSAGVAVGFVSEEVIAPETFTSTNNLSFYTKQINGVTPGLYKVKVDTINEEGNVLYTTQNLVVVKGVAKEEEKADLFETNQSGISQFLQNLLKSIFG